jgi:hypothetical protein
MTTQQLIWRNAAELFGRTDLLDRPPAASALGAARQGLGANLSR